jgi:hypothetical protein
MHKPSKEHIKTEELAKDKALSVSIDQDFIVYITIYTVVSKPLNKKKKHKKLRPDK